MKLEGLKKIWRKIKRLLQPRFIETLGIHQRVLIKQNTNKNYLPCCRVEQASDLSFPNALKITHENYLYPIYIRNGSSDVHVYKEVIEKEEYDFISSHEPRVIIDAGANIGLAAVYFARKFPNAKIISIEPEKNNFFFLQQNTKNYPNIIVMQAALWDKVGEIELLDT